MMEGLRPSTDIRSRLGWLILILLLLLRIPYSIVLTYASASSTGWGPAIYQLATYSLTALLIWWERDDLAAMHLDTWAVALILLFKPLQTIILLYWGIETPLTFPHPASLLIWATAMALTVALRFSPRRLAPVTSTTSAWLTAGLLAGSAISAASALDVFRHVQNLVPLPSVSASIGMAFFYQIGFAAVSEEPLFRGFLWGYLRRLGMRELWVWLVQALLFMIAHLYFVNALHFRFWILVPGSALLFGLFAWRSRSIAPGMLAHAAINSGIYVLVLNALAAVLK
jgi:membrane protease YdiL (CAAX protease family)